MLCVVTLSPVKQARDMALGEQQQGCGHLGVPVQPCELGPYFCPPCVQRRNCLAFGILWNLPRKQT